MKPIHRLDSLYSNKVEAAYARHLDANKNAGFLEAWRYEPFGLRLGRKTFYHPDFLVVMKDEMQIHEVKGRWRDDARAKIKVAAHMFPWFRVIAVTYKVKRGVYMWDYEEIKP